MLYWEKQKKIKAVYEMYSGPVRKKYGLTKMEYSILMFLYRNPSCDSAASIVQSGQFTKSHVSAAVRVLEKRKYIIGKYMDNNYKTIHLKLTGQAEEILREASKAEKRYADRIFEGFTEREMQQINNLLERICENSESELQNMKEGKKYA